MERLIKYLGIALGLSSFLLAFGFATAAAQPPGASWVRDLFPWQEGPLSYIFLASIFIAIGCPVMWIVLTEEYGAMFGGAVDMGVMFFGLTIFFFQQYFAYEDTKVLYLAIYSLLELFLCLGLLYWSKDYPIRDKRPMPPILRYVFGVLILALIYAGGGLILKSDDIMPWTIRNEASAVVFGWIFLGAAAYFVYANLRPSWHNTRGQLIGFLGYDLVLILPFIVHLENVPDNLKRNLVFYLVVLFVTTALAIYYLFIDEKTSPWGIQES